MADKPTDPPKRPRGRPSLFTPSLADEICKRLATGEPLAVICRDENMPHPDTVRVWQRNDEAFSAAIASAREDGFDEIAADCLNIADENGQDRRFVGGDGEEREVCNTEFVQRAKLRIETRLKLLAKWDPKRYGEKVALTGGSAEDAPLKIENVSDETRAKAILAVLAKAQAKG